MAGGGAVAGSRSWGQLMDNAAALVAGRGEELGAEYAQLSALLGSAPRPDWDTFVSICGKIITNCFCLRSDR